MLLSCYNHLEIAYKPYQEWWRERPDETRQPVCSRCQIRRQRQMRIRFTHIGSSVCGFLLPKCENAKPERISRQNDKLLFVGLKKSVSLRGAQRRGNPPDFPDSTLILRKCTRNGGTLQRTVLKSWGIATTSVRTGLAMTLLFSVCVTAR